MADEEQLKILRQGVAAWNGWREKNPEVRQTDLHGADLGGAQLVRTNLFGATLTDSSIYGVSVWGIEVNDGTKQQNLIITPHDEPVITVDNIKVAQFIYLLLNNQ